MLTTEEKERYDRQLRLSEIGSEGQLKLKAASVLLVGVGGLGCPAAQYLAAAGVGTIGLVDHDLVSESNLHRQILFTNKDVGKPKAAVAKQRLEELNSNIKLVAYPEALTPDNALDLFSQYDVIVDGTDNFQTKYLINDASLLTGKPMVSASIHRFQGQLSVFNYQNGPSYRCLFPDPPLQTNNCEETGVLGVLPGILGTLQAAEVLKLVLGIGKVLSGQLKLIDVLTMEDQLIQFDRNGEAIAAIKASGIQVEKILCEVTDDAIYLDVRELSETPVLTQGSVLQIPLNQLAHRYEEIPMDKEVIVCCQTGKRSAQAINYLNSEFGFDNLKNMDGGIQSRK